MHWRRQHRVTPNIAAVVLARTWQALLAHGSVTVLADPVSTQHECRCTYTLSPTLHSVRYTPVVRISDRQYSTSRHDTTRHAAMGRANANTDTRFTQLIVWGRVTAVLLALGWILNQQNLFIRTIVHLCHCHINCFSIHFKSIFILMALNLLAISSYVSTN